MLKVLYPQRGELEYNSHNFNYWCYNSNKTLHIDTGIIGLFFLYRKMMIITNMIILCYINHFNFKHLNDLPFLQIPKARLQGNLFGSDASLSFSSALPNLKTMDSSLPDLLTLCNYSQHFVTLLLQII